MADRERTPRAVAIGDLTGVGRCALAAALPVLGAMGVQACPLPSAVLSTHTGGFGQAVFAPDMTEFMRDTLLHWESLGLSFDAVYSGYLVTARQVELVRALMLRQQQRGCRLCVVDPAMADDGRLYQGLGGEMPRAMRELCAQATVITPNMTEAALLTGRPYLDQPLNRRQIAALLKALCALGCEQALITGVPLSGGRRANVCMRAGDEGFFLCEYAPVNIALPGAGDLFSAALTGAMLLGESVSLAMARTTHFLSAAVLRTKTGGANPREGVQYEALLPDITTAQIVPPGFMLS